MNNQLGEQPSAHTAIQELLTRQLNAWQTLELELMLNGAPTPYLSCCLAQVNRLKAELDSLNSRQTDLD